MQIGSFPYSVPSWSHSLHDVLICLSDVDVSVDAVVSAMHPHCFFSITKQGTAAVVSSLTLALTHKSHASFSRSTLMVTPMPISS